MKKIVVLIFIHSIILKTNAQTVTWADDIACIVYSHCSNCHNNTNGLAAFPLMNYTDSYAQRIAMKIFTANKSMPPYLPGTDKNTYAHQKNLTQAEIDLIAAWANAGAPEGNPANAPIAPTYTTPLSVITTPDFSERIPTFTVPMTGLNLHRCFVLNATSTTEKHISTIEILPSNYSAVHHVLLYSDTSSIPLALDASNSQPGYHFFGGVGSNSAKLLYGWMRGSDAYQLPTNMGIRLEPNAHLILQVDYAEDAGGKIDSTQLNLKFDNSSSLRIVDVAKFLNADINLQNPPLKIKADSVKLFREQHTVSSDITLLSIAPHAHHICTSINCYGITPTNDTIHLLQIDDWAVIWTHGIYVFKNPIKIPAGTILFGESQYDNTYLNANNPFSPSHEITAGTSDTTEMLLFHFAYLPYQVNDEAIISDTVSHTIHYINCSPLHTVTGLETAFKGESALVVYPNPNPANDYVTINVKEFDLLKPNSIEIYDALGKIIYSSTITKSTVTINTSQWSKGIYTINYTKNKQSSHHKLIIN